MSLDKEDAGAGGVGGEVGRAWGAVGSTVCERCRDPKLGGGALDLPAPWLSVLGSDHTPALGSGGPPWVLDPLRV